MNNTIHADVSENFLRVGYIFDIASDGEVSLRARGASPKSLETYLGSLVTDHDFGIVRYRICVPIWQKITEPADGRLPAFISLTVNTE